MGPRFRGDDIDAGTTLIEYRSSQSRNDLGEAIVGRSNAALDARIEMAVTSCLAVVTNGRCQPGRAIDVGEARRDLGFVAGETRHQDALNEHHAFRPHDLAIDALQRGFAPLRRTPSEAVSAADPQIHRTHTHRLLGPAPPAPHTLPP